jgi:hypothetical protein
MCMPSFKRKQRNPETPRWKNGRSLGLVARSLGRWSEVSNVCGEVSVAAPFSEDLTTFRSVKPARSLARFAVARIVSVRIGGSDGAGPALFMMF